MESKSLSPEKIGHIFVSKWLVAGRSCGSSNLRPLMEMTLSREELIQLQYMELQRLAHELFDAARFATGRWQAFQQAVWMLLGP